MNLKSIVVKDKYEHQAFNELVKVMYNTLSEVKDKMDSDFQLGRFSQDLTPKLQASILKDLESQGYSDKREGYFYILDSEYSVHNPKYFNKVFKKFTYKLG